jgi:hypothetical protein
MTDQKLIGKAAENARNILLHNFEYQPEQLEENGFLIIYDLESPLAEILTEAYSQLLPKARRLEFFKHTQEEVFAAINASKRGDLVVLIESTSFRVSNFRWRLELFNRGLKVIEHAHIGKNFPEEAETYLDTLNFDGEYYQKLSALLVEKLGKCQELVIQAVDGSELFFRGGMEKCIKNIGDYSHLPNKGSGFPIGEVFSENRDLEEVNGVMPIYAFADTEHLVVFCSKPIRLLVENGCVSLDPQENGDSIELQKLKAVLELIKTENPDQKVWIREIGLGLNRALTKTRQLNDISAYERVCGPHVSLGLKHDTYREKMADRNNRYHIDIFPDVDSIKINGEAIYQNGQFIL